MLIARASIIVLLLAVARAPAFAQQDVEQSSEGSRAAVLAAERDKKGTETSPPQRTRIEVALNKFDNLYLPFVLQSWHGFHLGGTSFPAGAGTKLGIGFTHDLGSVRPGADPDRANRVEVDSVAAYSTRGYSRGRAAFDVHRIGGSGLDAGFSVQRYEFPQQDFFGLSQDSLEDNRTNYLLKSTEATAEARWRPVRLFDFTGGVSYLKPRIGRGTDTRYPRTDHLFDPGTIAGYQSQPDFVRSDAGAALDWLDSPLYPHAGGRYGVQFSDYRDQDLNQFDFRRVSVDLQQYVPIPDRYRTVALHAAAVFTDADQGQDVPFYLEPTLGGAQALRGFREFRFQDRNSLLFQAEYRWEAWWALDGALFVDAGEVAARRKDFTLQNMDVSYGLGFRVHSNSAFVARLDLAFSREGFIPLLRFEHAF